MGWAYYNENNPFACAWLAELMQAGVIADGLIDGRSITDVQPEDLKGFTQCHFFAGIGGWSFALRLAGVPDDRPVWTGSCPCQPFSVAGKQGGTSDPRHLWPEMRRLIAHGNPPTVLGEQVASAPGRLWLAGVRADLEALGYAVGASDICAASVGAPHIRQRLYWVADRECDAGKQGRAPIKSRESFGASAARARDEFRRCGMPSGLANFDGRIAGDRDLQRSRQHGQQQEDGCCNPAVQHSSGLDNVVGDGRGARWSNYGEHDGPVASTTIASGRMGDGDEQRSQGWRQHAGEHADQWTPWSSSLFIPCLDGKYRRVPANEAGEPEPSLFPLAYGVPNRVGILRGSGNAIVPYLAAEFIQASFEAIEMLRALT